MRTHTHETENHNFYFFARYLCAAGLPRIPLIEDLTEEPIPLGSNILVEFDPASQWYNASLTIAAGWIRSGGVSSYNVYDHAPDNVRLQFKRFGLDAEILEKEGKFRIIDWYTFQLGQKSREKYAATSLKVTDLSLLYSRTLITRDALPAAFPTTYSGTGWADWKVGPNVLRIVDDELVIQRFNDEKSFIDLWRTRELPTAPATKSTQILGAVKGAYSDHVYKSMEAPVDCIIDFKLDETTDPAQNLVRIRSFKNVRFDGRWKRLKTDQNFEVTVEKKSFACPSIFVCVYRSTNLRRKKPTCRGTTRGRKRVPNRTRRPVATPNYEALECSFVTQTVWIRSLSNTRPLNLMGSRNSNRTAHWLKAKMRASSIRAERPSRRKP